MATPAKRHKQKTNTEKKSSPSSDRLATYRAKRRFDVTPEPAPRESSQTREAAEKKTSARRAFVVQKHDARRLHYDVRLDIDGAMASWAVPKGPSYDPAVRRLAVQTEDHPMDYNAFEGRIPDGEYGAGDVLLWDRGTYETVPPGQARAMLDKGHLHVRLSGEKLVGDWHLVRTGPSRGPDAAPGKAQWLMFKAKDAQANPSYDVVAERPESVVSGRMATRGPARVGASSSGKSAHALIEAVGEPELATAVSSLPDDGAWRFELKYDGYRIMAAKAGDEVHLYSRRSNDWTGRFQAIADAVRTLGARECVVDGEACVLDDAGRPSFSALQAWLGDHAKPGRLAYVAFDLLWLDGRDLRAEPLEARTELLATLLRGQGAPLSVSRAVEGKVADLLRAAKQGGLEGLVAKKKGSPYVAGRSSAWVKLRFDRRQDCAVAGWLPLKGADDDVGALLLAVAEGKRLVFAGRVGTGFSSRVRHELAKRLGRGRATPTVEGAPKIKDARWVEPKLVCECVFTEWTPDGAMRHPRFLAMREDKTPLECVRDPAGPAGAAPDEENEGEENEGEENEGEGNDGGGNEGEENESEEHHGGPERVRAPARRRDSSTGAAKAEEPVPHQATPRRRDTPKLANPTKVLFPRDDYKKQDIWDYYTAIAPVMLPHLSGRPLTLQRYPDGIDGQEWYQQNAPEKTPDFVRLVDVGPRHDAKKRIVCDDLPTLQWLANLAALTLHQWTSHVPPEAKTRSAIDHAMGRPDYVVLDLDPGDGPWSHLVEVARAVRVLLDALKLESVVKTSGKRGVHVVVPILAGPSHEEATGFAEQVARAVAKNLPGVATVERMKDKRHGKLYVDYGQNGEGRTIVAPYTIRARDGAVVSTPIEWDELDEGLDPTRFTIRTVLERVAKRGDLFAPALRGKNRLPRV